MEQEWATAPLGYVHETRVPLIYSFSICFPIMAFLFVGLRIYVRKNILGGIGPDDWLALMGAFCMTGVTGVAIWGTTIGYGWHIWEVDESSWPEIRTVITALPLIAQMGNMVLQLSLLNFYCRLIPYRLYHLFCYAIMAITASVCCSRVIFVSIWCFNLHTDSTLMCHDNQAAGTFHTALGVTTNIIVFFLPIPMLWRLKNASVLKRLGLIVIFSIGLIAVVACLSKAFVYKRVMMERDPPWVMSLLAIICQIELGAGISCACLPLIRPLLLNTFRSPKASKEKEIPAAEDILEEDMEAGSGAGTQLSRRARAGWEGKSLTSTWDGVQRFYHTRWGRQRSIIEVVDLSGLGVLDSYWDQQHGAGGKAGHSVFDCSIEMPKSHLAGGSGVMEYYESQKPVESTHLPLPAAVARSDRPSISWDESHIPRSPLSPQEGEIPEPVPSPRRLQASESWDDVLLSSMAPIAGGGGGGGRDIPTVANAKSTTSP